MLGYAFQAFGKAGHVDAAAVGRQMGVSAGTVRRWVREGLPERRRAAIAARTLPNQAALEQEHRELLYAREALRDIAGRGAPVNASWKEQGWLRPHVLAVVSIQRLGICVARIARAEGDAKSRERLRAGGGVVVEQEIFRNRFAAQVAKGELLEAVSSWRVVIPFGLLPRGRTEAWLADAERPSVVWLLSHPQVRIPTTRPRRRRAAAGSSTK